MAKIVRGENLIEDPDEEALLTPAERAEQALWWVKHESRNQAYPSIGDQLDMQYWDNINGTTNWKDAIDKVKADFDLETVDGQTDYVGYDTSGQPGGRPGKVFTSVEDELENWPSAEDGRGDDDTEEDIRNGTTSRQ